MLTLKHICSMPDLESEFRSYKYLSREPSKDSSSCSSDLLSENSTSKRGRLKKSLSTEVPSPVPLNTPPVFPSPTLLAKRSRLKKCQSIQDYSKFNWRKTPPMTPSLAVRRAKFRKSFSQDTGNNSSRSESIDEIASSLPPVVSRRYSTPPNLPTSPTLITKRTSRSKKSFSQDPGDSLPAFFSQTVDLTDDTNEDDFRTEFRAL